jgi:hypothetical protein
MKTKTDARSLLASGVLQGEDHQGNLLFRFNLIGLQFPFELEP